MLNARQGSILATSVSLVAVFLTLVVGGMAYVQSSQSRTLSDKFRLAAEQAARTGMDFVLGFGEANIDRETRLPRRWDSMSDGQVIDPVTEATGTKSGDVITDLRQAMFPGQVVGSQVREYVLGRQGQFVTTFKARIEQFRVSDNMPRQYRIGVIGRVRKIRNGTATNIDTNERDSIVTERVIVAHVGKQPVSRYAALIDTDVVRNWVPGEVVDGPVHINRGYVDENGLKGKGRNLRLNTSENGDSNGDTVKMLDVRSRMDIVIDDAGFSAGDKIPGNPGFTKPAGGEAYPIFNDEVTVTEIGQGDLALPVNSEDLQLTNFDHPLKLDDTTLRTVSTVAVTSNGKPWGTGIGFDKYSRLHADIFKSPANTNNSRYGPGNGDPRGPNPVPYPIQLPRSVRNRLATAVGAPPGGLDMSEVNASFGAGTTRWDRLKDGLYVPTTRFWAIDTAIGAGPNQPPPTDSFDRQYKATGGIYIRGNVEVMRMAAGGKKSYYLFQIGPGTGGGTSGNTRACYAVGINRETNVMVVNKLAVGSSDRNSMHMLAQIIQNDYGNNLDTLPGNTATAATNSTLPNPASWAADAGGSGIQVVSGEPAGTPVNTRPGLPPFNGVIYVDCAQFDEGRPEGGTYSLTSTPVTGNIFALGDPGRDSTTISPYMASQKRPLTAGGVVNSLTDAAGTACAYEGVATYVSDSEKGPATKLTLMSRGNVFIQNHVMLTSLVKQGISKLDGETFNYDNLAIGDSQDLLGIVADKQIVVGLCAPSMTSAANRTKIGTYVQAAIAALGDPAYDYQNDNVPDAKKQIPEAYAGSVGVEGLLQVYGTNEDYKVTRKPMTTAGSHLGTPGAGGKGKDTTTGANFLYFTELKNTAGGDVSREKGYPGNPIYEALYVNAATTPARDLTNNNPNKTTRGKLRILGSVTERKRGIKGQGNRSFDKDFKFDRRLLTIAPPIFPASLNVIVRTQSPFSPDQTSKVRAVPYRIGGTNTPGLARDLGFFGTDLPALP